jgi:hypothetical protein
MIEAGNVGTIILVVVDVSYTTQGSTIILVVVDVSYTTQGSVCRNCFGGSFQGPKRDTVPVLRISTIARIRQT